MSFFVWDKFELMTLIHQSRYHTPGVPLRDVPALKSLHFSCVFSADDICCGQSGTGTGYIRVLRFPLPILISPTISRT
jgi:hypothetical protein